jgi:hypothetical protein
MTHKDKVALAAGTIVGLWGGTFGAFLIFPATWAVTRRVLHQLDERSLELRAPVVPVRQLADEQPSSRGAIASLLKVDCEVVSAG